MGRPGRDVLQSELAAIQRDYQIDLTIANIENAAGGFGVTPKIYQELGKLPIQVFTSGNHIFDKHESLDQFPNMPKIIRPVNYPPGAPGEGVKYIQWNTHKLAVVNVIGRVFMHNYDCPFRALDSVLPPILEQTNLIIVDFHAEVTSEKQAMGWNLDGKVSAMYGTHTHVQTADDRILPNGTAYISDIGMTGPANGIIGMVKEPVLHRFRTQMPVRMEPDHNRPYQFNGIKLTLSLDTGKALEIERIQRTIK